MVFALVENLRPCRLVFRGLAQFGGDGYFIDLFAQEFLNVLEAALVIKADKGDGAALGTGTGGAAYAVNVILRVMGHVKVDDQVNVINVYSA